MKIALFHELSPLSGARKVVEEYGEALGNQHTIDLYYIDDTEDKNVSSIFHEVNFFKFKSKAKSRIYKDTVGLIKLYKLHRKVAQKINAGNYDFIFVSPSKFTQAPFLLRFLENKSVYFCQEPLRIIYDPLFSNYDHLPVLNKTYESLNRRIRKFIDSSNIKKANIVLANSKFSKKNIKKAYGLNSFVCYLGVNADKFYPKKVSKTNDLLFIGEKNLIEGFYLLEKIIKSFPKTLKAKLVLRDEKKISEKNLIKEYNASKIYLALSRNEPFGLSPIEAMSCGIPVIAIKEGGLAESVIDGKTGYLVPPEISLLKNKIEKLLKDESLRNSMGKEGRNYILNNFTWKKSADRFIQIVNKNL